MLTNITNKYLYRHYRYIVLSDILRINEAQSQILNGILAYEKKFNEMGATQYALDKNLSKTERVPGTTFNDNINKLYELGMVKEVKPVSKKRKWKKKKTRVSYPYTVTLLGIFAYFKSLSFKNFLNKEAYFNYLPSLIKNHWNELEQIPKSELLQERFSKYLISILIHTFDQIEIVHLLKEHRTFLYRKTLKENIKLDFRWPVKTHRQIIIERLYSNLNKKEKEFLQNEEKKLKKGGIILDLKMPTFDKIENNLEERIVFLFFYNIINLISDPLFLTQIHYLSYPNTEMKPFEGMKYANELNEKRIIANVLLIIFKDEELKRVFIDNFQSIFKYFETPKVITTINNIINDKK